VTNTVRAPAYPNIPTVKEAGYPALTIDGLVGLFGPADMPAALRERIAADIRAAAADPIIADRLNASGQILNIGGPAEIREVDRRAAGRGRQDGEDARGGGEAVRRTPVLQPRSHYFW